MTADASTSSVVRIRDGVMSAVDSPYPGSPGQLAAYYLVDCESREQALKLAAMMPVARHDAVEARPVVLATGMKM
ncbi:hypothetical protein GCM10027290_18570 [Micromonospora sonneratiae]